MGVEATPHCFSGIFCDLINYLVKNAVYFKAAQNYIGPAGYFRDPSHFSSYLKDSVFLPFLNNEEQHPKFAMNKERFTKLNGLMLVQFDKDSMIYPKETAQFASLDSSDKLIPMEQQPIYTQDSFGLKTLNEAGKVKVVALPGDHLQFSQTDISNTFVPFLKHGLGHSLY